jgi:hypothetical protein
MALSPSMMRAAVQIIGDRPDDRTILRTWRGAIGSGFLVGVPSAEHPGLRYCYVVTAHHVLDDQLHIEVRVPNPRTNGEFHPPVTVSDWRQPILKLDLALAPFPALGMNVSGLAIEDNVMPPNLMPTLGGTVFYIGLFDPLNRSMARSGTIGALDQEGLEHDGDYEYMAHLVDCRSYEGFSGSPCFSTAFFPILEPTEPPVPLDGPEGRYGSVTNVSLLCGIFTQHVDTKGHRDAVTRYGVGVMLPSDYIWEVFMSDEMKKEREDWDRSQTAGKPRGPGLRKASVKGTDEYERFEELARHVANTPKPKDPVDEKGAG